MFAKVAFGPAVVLATASGALAATKTPSSAPSHDAGSVHRATPTCAQRFSWGCGLSTDRTVFGTGNWARGY
jgi:hypothetical protein